MEKINVVLVLLNLEALEAALQKLNPENINLTMIMADGDPNEKIFQIGEKEIPKATFSAAYKIEKKYKNFIWLVSGGADEDFDLAKIKNFLMTLDVPEKNIINLDIFARISETWLANLRHVEEYGADYFATGNEYMRDGLNFNFIFNVQADKATALNGVNLADSNQDLRQSYLTAQYVFSRVEPGTIKFVLIGLSPYSFRYDNEKDFANQKNLQYLFALKDFAEETPRAKLLKNLFSDDIKNIFETSAQADLNFAGIKAELNREFSVEAITDWEDDIKPFTNVAAEANVQILKDYIELCLANGAKPIGVVFPFFAAVKRAYNKKLLREFRASINELAETHEFLCVDMFDLNIDFDCFCDMTHLNEKGSLYANALIALNLFSANLIPAENFCDMTYEYFDRLASGAAKYKDEYNALTKNIFETSAQMIRSKDKIKIGFVLYEAAQWCGDDLYNLFANDKRFEPTIFLCWQIVKLDNKIGKDDFLRDVEQFKSRGLNVVAMDTWKAKMPVQDVLIVLTPYFSDLVRVFRLKNLNTRTLITHIDPPFSISPRGKKFYNKAILNVAWKVFLSSSIELELYKEKSNLGMPYGLYSGYPRVDALLKKDSEIRFEWKMIRPDAKKIIWAPDCSINDISTFKYNYKFFYDFAKAHPEISWVVKPNPNLATFLPEAYEEYLQAWNDLPNAKVYTGDYYQDIFATSDGMIHDSGSFLAEYQYVNKPMIFLTRDTQEFNELGEEVLNVSYLVDGQDLEEIAAMIQRVIIEGDDYKAAERQEVFDKYLNYSKTNGLSASEFIYKSIADEFKEPTA